MKVTFSPKDQELIELLGKLKSTNVDYPPELLARRRAALIKQITKQEKVRVGEISSLQDEEIIRQLKSLAAVKIEYPPELMARRRSAFANQIMRLGLVGWWEAVLFSIQSKLIYISKISRPPVIEVMRTSLVIGSIIVAAYMGFFINSDRGDVMVASNTSPTRMDVSKPYLATATTTLEVAQTICKPGYAPPLCLAKKVENTQALSYQGNGFARAAVAKDTLQGFDGIHQPSNVNDGLYGSGASWVSKTANSWIKIDLGRAMPINTINFGKDRVSNIDGRNPGQFTVAVASYDNVYADGDSSNDINEYEPVYDSRTMGFTGVVSGSETVQVAFEPVIARYVKITVTNPGTAIDEVEVFFLVESPSPDELIGKSKEPPAPKATLTLTNTPSRTPTNTPSRTPTNTSTPIPTNTPSSTYTWTPLPTSTPSPTYTWTPLPTSTPLPTNTSTPVLTSTPLPTNTSTPLPSSTPYPTNTLMPTSTLSPVPAP